MRGGPDERCKGSQGAEQQGDNSHRPPSHTAAAARHDLLLQLPQVEKLQQALHSLEEEAELVRSQLSNVNQEKLGHTQEVSDLRRKLQDAEKKVRDHKPAAPLLKQLLRDVTPPLLPVVLLTGGGAGGRRQKADEGGGGAPSGPAGAGLCHSDGGDPQTAAPEPGAPAAGPRTTYIHPCSTPIPAPPDSSHTGTSFVFQLAELQLQSLELHNLNQEQQDLRSRLSEVDTRRTQAEEQVRSEQNLLGQCPGSQFLD